MAANAVVCSEVWPKFELIQAFIIVLVTYNDKEDPLKIKNEGARVVNKHMYSVFCHNIAPIVILWGFFQTLKVS